MTEKLAELFDEQAVAAPVGPPERSRRMAAARR
jgi:hypothetical protein